MRYRGVVWALRAAANRIAPVRGPEHTEWGNRFNGAQAMKTGDRVPLMFDGPAGAPRALAR